MKRFSRELTAALLVLGSALFGFQLQTSPDLGARVEDLEDRVTALEREVKTLGGSSASAAGQYTIDLQVNLGGPDGGIWVATGARSCKGAGGAADMHEGFQIVLRDERDDEVGTGYFEEGRLTAYGCVVRAEIEVEKADYYYLSVGPWNNFEAEFDLLEGRNWEIVLTATP